MSAKSKTIQAGRWLKGKRSSLGMSLRDFGLRCGVSHMAVSLWERGTHSPSERCVRKLARGLGMSVDKVRSKMVP